jgi:hypothetical protein
LELKQASIREKLYLDQQEQSKIVRGEEHRRQQENNTQAVHDLMKILGETEEVLKRKVSGIIFIFGRCT